MQSMKCQRWNNRREMYRPAGEPIDPRRYEVVPLEELPAKRFVVKHHYSGSYPAARFRAALMRKERFRKSELVGVAVFSVPMNNAVIPKYCGLSPNAGVELGRFVLLDDVPANGESWFLGQAFRLLATERPEIRAVLSYADPVPRHRCDGSVITPGHVGTVYQSHNGIAVGRSSARKLIISHDGLVVSGRMLSKLRNDERGATYSYRKFLEIGAPKRRLLESGADYVVRALREGPFSQVRHPGNHAYVWAIGDRRARKLAGRGFATAQPYPKAKDTFLPYTA